jgi:hypothetical protein
MLTTISELVPIEKRFQFHSAVAARWHDYARSTTLLGERLFQFGPEHRKAEECDATTEVYERKIKIFDMMVVVIAQAFSDKPYVDFWCRVVFGHTGTSKVNFPYESLVIANVGVRLNTLADGHIGHGQGVLERWRWDFERVKPVSMARKRIRPLTFGDAVKTEDETTWPLLYPTPPPYFSTPKPPKWLISRAAKRDALQSIVTAERRPHPTWSSSLYVPAFPGQTGDQEIFGRNHVLADLAVPDDDSREEVWFAQLRHEAHRKAFYNPDGTLATVEKYPQLVLHSDGAFHPDSKGTPWFAPDKDDYYWMGKTPKGERWRFWDKQHASVAVLCQVYWLYGDKGLGLLIRELAETYLFAFPVVDKGTTHQKRGQERAQGRPLESLAALYSAYGDERLKTHALAMFEIQDIGWRQHGIQTHWEKDRNDKWYEHYYVHEVGEHVAGLAALAAMIGIEHPAYRRVIDMGVDLATFCLKWFVNYGAKQSPVYATPYEVDVEGKWWSKSPSWGLSTWSLTALQLLDRYARHILNEDEGHKLDAILKQYIDDARPPRSGGWPETWEFLI